MGIERTTHIEMRPGFHDRYDVVVRIGAPRGPMYQAEYGNASVSLSVVPKFDEIIVRIRAELTAPAIKALEQLAGPKLLRDVNTARDLIGNGNGGGAVVAAVSAEANARCANFRRSLYRLMSTQLLRPTEFSQGPADEVATTIRPGAELFVVEVGGTGSQLGSGAVYLTAGVGGLTVKVPAGAEPKHGYSGAC